MLKFYNLNRFNGAAFDTIYGECDNKMSDAFVQEFECDQEYFSASYKAYYLPN